MVNVSATNESEPFWHRTTGSNRPESEGESPKGTSQASRDASLLDAYSQAVIGVVGRVGPAVVSVTGHPGDGQQGMGSGFVITPDGFALTNSHVVRGRNRLRAVTEDGDALEDATHDRRRLSDRRRGSVQAEAGERIPGR